MREVIRNSAPAILGLQFARQFQELGFDRTDMRRDLRLVIEPGPQKFESFNFITDRLFERIKLAPEFDRIRRHPATPSQSRRKPIRTIRQATMTTFMPGTKISRFANWPATAVASETLGFLM